MPVSSLPSRLQLLRNPLSLVPLLFFCSLRPTRLVFLSAFSPALPLSLSLCHGMTWLVCLIAEAAVAGVSCPTEARRTTPEAAAAVVVVVARAAGATSPPQSPPSKPSRVRGTATKVTGRSRSLRSHTTREVAVEVAVAGSRTSRTSAATKSCKYRERRYGKGGFGVRKRIGLLERKERKRERESCEGVHAHTTTRTRVGMAKKMTAQGDDEK